MTEDCQAQNNTVLLYYIVFYGFSRVNILIINTCKIIKCMLQSILIENLNAMKKRVSLLLLWVIRELCLGWEHGSPANVPKFTLERCG